MRPVIVGGLTPVVQMPRWLRDPAERACLVGARWFAGASGTCRRVEFEHLVKEATGGGIGRVRRGGRERGAQIRRLIPLTGRRRECDGGRGRRRSPRRLGAGEHLGPVVTGAQQRAAEHRWEQRRAAPGPRGRVHVHVVGANGRRAVDELPGADRARPQTKAGAADATDPGDSARQAGRVGVCVELSREGIAQPEEEATPGHTQGRCVRRVLELRAFLIELAGVDDHGAKPGQYAGAKQHHDYDADRAALVTPDPMGDPARERRHQVSHGMTPCAVSVTGEPRLPAPPISAAIAPIGVMKENW